MVGAVLAGDGLERVAEIASAHAGAPVAVIVPRLGISLPHWERYARYVAARLSGGRPQRPSEVAAEVPISSGGRELGAVLLLGSGGPAAGEYMHMAAIAALTEVAVAEARDDTEQSLRGSFLEEVLSRPELDVAEVSGAPLGWVSTSTPGTSLSALRAADVCGPRSPPRFPACSRSRSASGSMRCFRASREQARRVASRLGRHGAVGVSSYRSGPADVRRALEEAELVLGVTAAGGGPPGDEIGESTYRLLFRVLASHPHEVRSFYDDTVAPLVAYDEQYSTDLLGTLSAYLDNNCNMAATAHAIHAHRHTVGYRLERVKDLTGLDPLKSEDRERLGLGLKAYRIIAPSLPR